MITLSKVKTIDETAYNCIRCTQCKNILGLKPKGSKVHRKRLFLRARENIEHIILTCWRCKSRYNLYTDSDQ